MKRSLMMLALLAAGCTTVDVIPQAEHIKTTRNKEDVANCQLLGTVEAHPPYIGPHDAANQLKNKAALLNADTVFVSGYAGDVNGFAYRCSGAAAVAPTPAPATPVPATSTSP